MSISLVAGISAANLQYLYSDPSIQHTGDDAHPAEPIDHPLASYVSVFHNEEFIGAYLLIEFSEYECEVHCFLLPASILHSKKIAMLFGDYVFGTRAVERMTGWIREDLTRAYNHCVKYGFKFEGRKRNAVRVNGQPKDLIMVGLTRSDWEKVE